MEPLFQIEVDGQDVGPAFSSEEEAHNWVALNRPGEVYTLLAMTQRAGAGRYETFRPREES